MTIFGNIDESIPPSCKHKRNKFNIFLFIVAILIFNFNSTKSAEALSDNANRSKNLALCKLKTRTYKTNIPEFKIEEFCKKEIAKDKKTEERIKKFEKLLENHPMQEMSKYLAKLDPKVAAFLVGIAKQESNWGKRSPWKGGIDCYNYWGYKTSGSRGKALGHACFGSREEAVATVSKRIDYFVNSTNRNNATKMLVWKCGRTCAGHNRNDVNRWVYTVDTYSNKVLMFDKLAYK